MLARHLDSTNPRLLSAAAGPVALPASRRQFLKASAAAGAGLVIGFAFGGNKLARAAGGHPPGGGGAQLRVL